MTMKIDQKARIVFWGYVWVSSDQIAQQLGQHQHPAKQEPQE
jgi:hypothetical protein